MRALHRQVGGNHYKNLAIQPLEYGVLNGLGCAEMLVLKYITRHKTKGKAQDLRKAIHVLEILLDLEYGDTVRRRDVCDQLKRHRRRRRVKRASVRG